MSTITLWLLFSMGYPGAGGDPSALLERFTSASDCEAVRKRMDDVSGKYTKPLTACIEAKVYKP